MRHTSIYFKYGCMNSGKSLELIKIAYNYLENEIKPLVLKPKLDTRVTGKIYSRTNLMIDAVEVNQNDYKDILEKINKNIDNPKIILIDEIHFFSKKSVDKIIDYSYDNNIDTLIFFGLKVNFRGELFEGSKRVIERADKIEESTSICWCGKKARQNARVVNGKIIKDGDEIVVDDLNSIVRYIPLCNYHFYKKKIKPND